MHTARASAAAPPVAESMRSDIYAAHNPPPADNIITLRYTSYCEMNRFKNEA